jgi:anti-sigma regulatory factor (Ser/Thr protein kinase)
VILLVVGRAEWSRRAGRVPRGGSHTRTATLTFVRDARSVPEARRAVGDVLERWSLSGERSPLELVTSELFTNAVRHGRGRVTVTVEADESVVRLEVCDEGGGQPTLRPVDTTGNVVGGWGLHLVDQLVAAWGSEVRDGRTVVWVERVIGTGP